MPELPEVETIARGVHERVSGDRIVEVWFGSHPQPFKTPPLRQARGLQGRAFLAVYRAGKHIVCELGAPDERGSGRDNNLHEMGGAAAAYTVTAQWIVHLGMTGRLLVTTADAPLAPHTHARLTLASGRELRFVDPRRFGRLDFIDLSRASGFRAPGADPLTVSGDAFQALFHGRKTPIKAALLNQKLLSGVGNIYADESLFLAGIRPRRQCGRLTRSELERLRKALREVLQHAIRLGGSSVSDYVDANGVRGFFQLEHCVYQRDGLPCLRCQRPIKRMVLAGRGTHYCPQCQR
jgi:formamidopyrimidine-DNA glycosylase